MPNAHERVGYNVLSCCDDDAEEEALSEEDGTTWQKKASLMDAKDAVQDVAFSPSHLGLRLVCCPASLTCLSLALFESH